MRWIDVLALVAVLPLAGCPGTTGVVRSVDQQLVVEASGTYRTVSRSFSVTDLGTANVSEPPWVCEAVRESRAASG